MKINQSKLSTMVVFTILFSLFSGSAFASNFMSQGLLVENNTGAVLQEQNADVAFNPASAVKILTAYAVSYTHLTLPTKRIV